MEGWGGHYLVAGRAVYRIEREDGATLVLTILAGSATLAGRTVRVARSNAEANIALGHEALVATKPIWVGEGLLDGAGGDDGDQGGEPADDGGAGARAG